MPVSLQPVEVARLDVDPVAPRALHATRPRSFTVAEDPPGPGPGPGPSPGPGATNVLNATDTFRGGAFLVVSADGQLFADDSQDSDTLTNFTLSNALRDLDGVTLDTGAGAGSVASATSDSLFTHYDASIDVNVDLPSAQTAGEVELASLEGDNGARVWLAKGFGAENRVVARGAPDGSTVFAPTFGATITLRLVRGPSRVYGFVGIRTRSDPEQYLELVPVLDYPLPEPLPHSLTVRARNLAQAARIRTTINNFTVRSAVDINGRLTRNKRTPNPFQVTGIVPAATIDEVGTGTANVFGLFGADEFDFVYTYGPGTPVGTEVVRTFRAYSDPFTVP